MARSKKGAAAASGRGSPEAIQKRRVARRLNDMMSGRSGEGSAVRDGRTERKRLRILGELDKATRKGGKGMKPIELLQRVNALLDMGEPVSAIRKVARVRPVRHLTREQAAHLLKEVHQAYAFRPAAYRFLGLPHEALVDAKLVDAGAPRRGRPPKHSRGS